MIQTASKKREPIYNENADARAAIRAAVERAEYSHKRVLLKWGGNWCGWCFKLHDVFTHSPEVAAVLRDEYELVLIDSNRNADLMREYQVAQSFPFLTVLDGEGRLLVAQQTEVLERGTEHDPQKVLEFLRQWKSSSRDAEQVLSAALERAGRENKRVLLHVGAPTCGWCVRLDRFLSQRRDVIARDYVDVPIDVARMTNGAEVAARLRSGREPGGIPWMAILAADGSILVTSDGPGGNIGYPFQPQEIAHFVSMLNGTRQNLTDADVADLERQLREYAAQHAKGG